MVVMKANPANILNGNAGISMPACGVIISIMKPAKSKAMATRNPSLYFQGGSNNFFFPGLFIDLFFEFNVVVIATG